MGNLYKKTRMALFATALFGMAPTTVSAQWASTTWELNEAKSRFTCAFCTKADEEYQRSYESALTTMDKWVSAELKSISIWMSNMGYTQAKLPVIPGPFYVYADRNRSENFREIVAGRLGSYHPDDGIELNYRAFITDISPDGNYGEQRSRDNRVTLAHEVYHGVQAAVGTMSEEQTWFSEGMPEAVGRAWEVRRHGNTEFAAPNYSQPLHEPDDVYSRAHFFYRLGEDLRSPSAVAYFKELEKTSGHDGFHGVMWIDRFLDNTIAPLADYYPQFITRHAVTSGYFSEQDQIKSSAKDFSPATNVAPGASSVVQIDTDLRTVNPVAAHYTEASSGFSGDWDPIEDSSRIYANLLSIHEADRTGDVRLIVDRTLLKQDERYADLVYAAPGNYDPPLRVRVTNVAQNPVRSTSQNFRLRLETSQIKINPPTCMKMGQNVPILIDGPLTDIEKQKFFAHGPSRIRASAGKMQPDLSYTAPNSAQTVTLSLQVPTLDNRMRRIQLPSIKVTRDDCMVRLSTPDLTVTYTPNGDYAEFKTRGTPNVLYFKSNDVAMYNGGWVPLPRMMVHTMITTMRAGVLKGMAEQPPELRDDFQMHNMPLVFSRRFSWDSVRKAPDVKGGALQRRPAACPNQEKGCTTSTTLTEGGAVQTIFFSDGSPARVMIPGAPFTFEYGGFDIRRPPGW